MTDMAENRDLRVRDGTAGAALAAARMAQNLSVADVARQLKLSVQQVAALEAGEFDRLPGPVFVRGFVRNYARLLKMDPERLLESIAPPPSGNELRESLRSRRETPFPTKRERRWPRYGVMVLFALALLAGYEFYWNEPPSDRAVKPAAPPSVEAPALASERAPAVAATRDSSDPDPAKIAQTQAGGSVAQPGQEAREAAADSSRGAASSPGELEFFFRKDSWTEVRERNSGRVIFTRLNSAGTRQRVSGNPPFFLVIGNAEGVQLTYKGRPVDLASHIVKDGVARLTLE